MIDEAVPRVAATLQPVLVEHVVVREVAVDEAELPAIVRDEPSRQEGLRVVGAGRLPDDLLLFLLQRRRRLRLRLWRLLLRGHGSRASMSPERAVNWSGEHPARFLCYGRAHVVD